MELDDICGARTKRLPAFQPRRKVAAVMQKPSTVRMALIQPQSFWGPNEKKNLQNALEWLDRSSKAGVQLVVFPEGYPGPTNPDNSYDALTPLSKRAAELNLHVIAANIESA